MIVTTSPSYLQTVAVVTQPPKLTRAGRHESALISCVLILPELLEQIPQLLPEDFAEYGHAEAFEVLKFDYFQTGEISPEFLQSELKDLLGSEVHPAGMICDWITQYVWWKHWKFYACKVAAACYARAVEQCYSDGIHEIRFGQNVAEFRQIRSDQDTHINQIEKRLKDLL